MKLAGIAVGCLVLIGCAGLPVPAVVDLQGERAEPLPPAKGDKASVLVFITTECPIANAMAPALRRLVQSYSSRGVRFTMVHVDTELSLAQAREHASEYSIAGDIVVDRQHHLVQAAQATITPEAVVFDATGEVVYRGRINNRYVGLGNRRSSVTRHELRDCLDDVLAGRPVRKPSVAAVGCSIAPPRR